MNNVNYTASAASCTIPLTRGQITVVSPEDYEYLLQWGWQASLRRSGKYYATRNEYDRAKKRQTGIQMGRVILERILERPLHPGMLADHIDRDPLNNTRENLREANRSFNNMNRELKLGVSGIKGVSWDNGYRKWRSELHDGHGSRLGLGYFKERRRAQRARLRAYKNMFGQYES